MNDEDFYNIRRIVSIGERSKKKDLDKKFFDQDLKPRFLLFLAGDN